MIPVVFAQVPVPPDARSADGGLVGTVVTIVIVAALLVLMVLALRKLLKRRKPVEAEKLPAQQQVGLALQAPAKVEEQRKVVPPPSEEQQRVEALQAERARVEAEAQRADQAEKERLAQEGLRLKEAEEEAKRAAYRAQKAAEVEEKERRRKEREESERLKVEEERRAHEAEALARIAAEEAQKRRVEAEAGHTLAYGLQKTRSEGFMAKLNGLFGAPKIIDDQVLAELEEVLFTADIGVKTASSLVEVARGKVKAKELDSSEMLKRVIRAEVEKIVDLKSPHGFSGGAPYVIMVVGVNGAGKTTTIGKLAAKARAVGKKVVLAAGDTFRAAAAEQLDVWAERSGAELVKGRDDADPASVVFDAIKRAKEIGADVVIADTAGRLHTKLNLMEELKKVKRVIEKAVPGAPHEVLLVLDATNGQNAIAQARQFKEAVGVTAIALTKLDGTAKGGVIIGICDELKVPVSWAGVGEKVGDLRAFEAKEFVQALFD